MRHIYSILGGLLFVGVSALQSQTTLGFSRVDTVPVFENSNQLLFPWAGGLNFCQFSEIDLNQDGIMDLFVFDRSGNKIQTYINRGTANQVDYVLAPQFLSKFPLMHDWVLLRDYNCDGKMDIFTYSIAGFSIFKNVSTIATGLQFQLVQYMVNTDRSPNSSHFIGNLFVSQVDIPAIRDVDGDGDLDVLTFENGGGHIEYHKNMSMELYGICDSVHYIVATNCWGEITENASNSFITLNTPCPAPPLMEGKNINPNPYPQHSGSALECINTDNDNDQDILISDIGNSKFTYCRNGGTNSAALMDLVDDSFPIYDTPLIEDVFLAAFHLDVNNDGKKDIIFSPNAPNTSENFNSCFYYRNTTSNTNVHVNFVQNNFLQDSMIEVGEGCYPVFFDYDNDGDKDLLIGDYGYYQHLGPYQAKIALYKNIGSVTAPSFVLQTRDFANVHANVPSISGMAPTFGDLDGDGDKDMIIGDMSGKLNYFEKQPGPNDNFVLIASFYQGIDVGNYAAPQLIDVDRDGKLDLLIGEQSGNINYYHNDGTTSVPVFTLVTPLFGNVYVTQPAYSTGYSVPCMYDDNGHYVFLVGSERGWLNRYDNIDGNLSGTFTRTDSTFISTFEGGNVSAAIADLNNDGLYDIVMGNYSGGVSMWYGDANVSTGENISTWFSSFSLFPNPANDNLTIKTDKIFPGKQTFFIYDLSGKEILRTKIISQQTQINVGELPSGVYICRLVDEHGFVANNKLVITR
ncbi:MAG: T9SS type A sorting domain-containing protein [Bacteroidetes bacterium]|nr:T9SS type A sorting domain-containing protein [Bacteroidota bacterium]